MGDGDSDHYCWMKPEHMTTSRKAYKIDAEHPGSDLAGETAAAMAAASIVFKPSNSRYSATLLIHARQVMEDPHPSNNDAKLEGTSPLSETPWRLRMLEPFESGNIPVQVRIETNCDASN